MFNFTTAAVQIKIGMKRKMKETKNKLFKVSGFYSVLKSREHLELILFKSKFYIKQKKSTTDEEKSFQKFCMNKYPTTPWHKNHPL